MNVSFVFNFDTYSTIFIVISTGFFVGKIIMSLVWAKFWIMISFDGLYVYTTELFPTAIR